MCVYAFYFQFWLHKKLFRYIDNGLDPKCKVANLFLSLFHSVCVLSIISKIAIQLLIGFNIHVLSVDGTWTLHLLFTFIISVPISFTGTSHSDIYNVMTDDINE